MVADPREVDSDDAPLHVMLQDVAYRNARTGPPQERTPRIDAIMRRLLGIGLSLKLTAYVIGVDPRTLRRWKAADPNLSALLESGRAEGIAKALAVVSRKIDADDLNAATWFLRHRAWELMPESPVDPEDAGEDLRSTAEALHAECMAMRATATAL